MSGNEQQQGQAQQGQQDQQRQPKVDQTEKEYANLVNVLGFDLVKDPALDKDGLKELVEELNKENRIKAKEKVKATLSQVQELRRNMDSKRREFEKQDQKFKKELGNLLRRCNAALNGQPPPKENDQQQGGGGGAAEGADAAPQS